VTTLAGDPSSTPPPRGDQDPNVYLTRAEAAAEVRVSLGTITNWVRTGRLQAVRTPTGAYRIRRRWLNDALRR
jgi:excisionase family DNA binding protein